MAEKRTRMDGRAAEHFEWRELDGGCELTDAEIRNLRGVADKLERLRGFMRRPLVVTSAYRPRDHPLERDKERPGTHALGLAVDISTPWGARDIEEFLGAARALGFRRQGIRAHGPQARRYVHLDLFPGDAHHPCPAMWTYP